VYQRTLTSSFYRGCAGVVVVFDLNDSSSFESLDNWFSEADRYSQAPIILVGNKKDLDADARCASPEDIARTGREFVEASALTGEGVNEIFVAMVKAIQDGPEE
jgi:GTPase SAR1 family protein